MSGVDPRDPVETKIQSFKGVNATPRLSLYARASLRRISKDKTFIIQQNVYDSPLTMRSATAGASDKRAYPTHPSLTGECLPAYSRPVGVPRFRLIIASYDSLIEIYFTNKIYPINRNPPIHLLEQPKYGPANLDRDSPYGIDRGSIPNRESPIQCLA